MVIWYRDDDHREEAPFIIYELIPGGECSFWMWFAFRRLNVFWFNNRCFIFDLAFVFFLNFDFCFRLLSFNRFRIQFVGDWIDIRFVWTGWKPDCRFIWRNNFIIWWAKFWNSWTMLWRSRFWRWNWWNLGWTFWRKRHTSYCRWTWFSRSSCWTDRLYCCWFRCVWYLTIVSWQCWMFRWFGWVINW